jgi:ATP-dependent DNA helicase RecQ
MEPWNRQPLEKVLSEVFGHDAFRPGQRRVIEILLEGRPAMALFPTGGGKSLCHQLPTVVLGGLTVVVSPLIALMKDQVDALQRKQIAAARLDSTTSPEEEAAILADLPKGGTAILHVSPERFASDGFQHLLTLRKPELIAIDEAHCISEWGHNFRPDYLRLARLVRKTGVRRILALTATATPRVARDMRKAFGIRAADCTTAPFHRPNLSYHATTLPEERRDRTLLERLADPANRPAIVYTTLRDTAVRIAALLVQQGIEALPYHAGFPDSMRAATQQAFVEGRCQVVVATIAFGMGIDKADVRCVIHYNVPKSLENLQQEAGRAGRDGLPAHCEILHCPSDFTVLGNFITGAAPDAHALDRLVDHFLRRGKEFDIGLRELSEATDLRRETVETVLAFLEREKIIRHKGMFHAGFAIDPRRGIDQIISGHPLRHAAFLRRLFALAEHSRRGLVLETADAAETIGTRPARIIAALEDLAAAEDITLRPVKPRLRLVLTPAGAARRVQDVAEEVRSLFKDREQADFERLEAVRALVLGRTCIARRLVRHFGGHLQEDCGRCARCKGIRPVKPPRTAERRPDSAGMAAIAAIVREDHPCLRGHRAMARFLCGVASPATWRERLTRHESFGLLRDLPMASVLEILGSAPGR